ncbi:MAG: integrase [Nitrosomonas sp.]
MDMWHSKIHFKDCADRRIQLLRFINFYNTVKPHKSLNNATPYEILNAYFNQPLCTTLRFLTDKAIKNCGMPH